MATRHLIARALLVVLIVAAPSAAQSTRVEAIAEGQAEKAKALGVEGPSEAEQIIRRVLSSPLLSGGDGIYPWFGSIYGGTGLAIGAGLLKRFESAAYLNLHSGMSLNNSLMMRGALASPELWRGKLQLDASAQWMSARGVSFYGFGQDSDARQRERFDFAPVELTGNLTIEPRRYVSLIGSYSFLDFKTTRYVTRFPAEADAPGQAAAQAVLVGYRAEGAGASGDADREQVKPGSESAEVP